VAQTLASAAARASGTPRDFDHLCHRSQYRSICVEISVFHEEPNPVVITAEILPASLRETRAGPVPGQLLLQPADLSAE